MSPLIRDEPHIPEDQLELYLLRHSLTTAERANIEEHFLACQFCNSRLKELQELIDLLRAAFRVTRRSKHHKVFKKALLA
jgi:hypothetical protein